MNNLVHNQVSPSDTYIAQLKEQFERIDQVIKKGETIKLDLTENGRSISLTIDRNSVVETDLPVEQRSMRKTRLRSGNKSLIAGVTNSFSFNIGDINRQVKTDDIEAQINKASNEKTDDKPKRIMRSSGADVAPPSLPNPAIKYIGDNWRLAEDCVYTTNDDFTITAKSGFQTDLASIPRIFWALIASFELSITAPVFHDLIYRSAGEVVPPDGEVAPVGKIFTRQETDDIFLELMTRAEVSYWKRNVAYLAVRHFAEHAWRKRRSD